MTLMRLVRGIGTGGKMGKTRKHGRGQRKKGSVPSNVTEPSLHVKCTVYGNREIIEGGKKDARKEEEPD